MFASAVKWGFLKANPCRCVPRLRLPEQEFQFYDRKQTDAFLAKAAQVEPDFYAFFATAFKTGMRLGELLGLEWGDIDFVTGRIHLRRSHSEGHTTSPKSGKPRLIPMAARPSLASGEGRSLKEAGDQVKVRDLTERYAHLAPAALQSYVNVLDGMPMTASHPRRGETTRSTDRA